MQKFRKISPTTTIKIKKKIVVPCIKTISVFLFDDLSVGWNNTDSFGEISLSDNF